MLDYRKALNSPSSVYSSPEQVLTDLRLDREGKRAILKSWEQDAFKPTVARDSRTDSGERNLLSRVRAALESLSESERLSGMGPERNSGQPTQALDDEHSGETTREAEAGPQVSNLAHPTQEVLHVDHPLSEALLRMRNNRLPVMPVADGDEVVGILTARDILKRAKRNGRKWRRAKVSDQMSRNVVFCFENDDLQTVKDAMERGKTQHSLVLNNEGHFVGTIALHAVGGAMAAPQRSRNGLATAKRNAQRRSAETAGTAQPKSLNRPKSYSVRPKVRR